MPAPSALIATAGLTASWLERIAGWVARLSASTWFLILALPMGLFLLVSLPPFQGQDETQHFYRAYTITEGHFVEPIVHGRTGAAIPGCVIAFAGYHTAEASKDRPLLWRDAMTEPQSCAGQNTFVAFENTAIYSPLPYLPQAAALGLTHATHLPLFVQFFAGRLAALAAYLAVVYAALRITPRGEGVILVLATLPMSLLLAVTYSADTMTISMALLMVAAVLRCIVDRSAGWHWFMVAAVAAFALSLTKPTYAVLTLILLLVPARIFPFRRFSILAVLATLAIIATASGAWYLETRNISLARFLAPPTSQYHPGAQISFILHHPMTYIAYIGQTFLGSPQGDFLWSSFAAFIGSWRTVGSNLAPVWVTVIAFALLVQAYARSFPRQVGASAVAILKASLSPILVVANALLVATSLFVETIAPGGIITVSGRYLIPTLAVPLASFSVLEARRPQVRSSLPLVPWIVVMLVWLVVKVRLFFY